MKIAIMSDSHDNVSNIEKVLLYLKENEITEIFHAGDLAAPSLLIKTFSNFEGTIHLIFGNIGDRELLPQIAARFSNIKYYNDKAEVEIDGKKIVMVHQPEKIDELDKSKYDLVIFGHNHQAEIKEEGKTLLVNPGTVGGMYAEATFAIYDTESGKAEMIQVNKL